MIIIGTTALFTHEVSFKRTASEITIFITVISPWDRNQLVSNWEQNMLKVSKLSLGKGSLS